MAIRIFNWVALKHDKDERITADNKLANNSLLNQFHSDNWDKLEENKKFSITILEL